MLDDASDASGALKRTQGLISMCRYTRLRMRRKR